MEQGQQREAQQQEVNHRIAQQEEQQTPQHKLQEQGRVYEGPGARAGGERAGGPSPRASAVPGIAALSPS